MLLSLIVPRPLRPDTFKSTVGMVLWILQLLLMHIDEPCIFDFVPHELDYV